MVVKELAEYIGGELLIGDGEHKVETALASDLMSDVLTVDEIDLVLITGLCTQQVIRTADMSDINTIIFARGKNVTKDIIELAEDHEMTIISSDLPMFKLCGMLYDKLKSVY